MSKPAGQRTHKAEIEARRVRGGYEVKPRPTHPQREARRQAAAYRDANPLAESKIEITYPNGIFAPPVFEAYDARRYAESYRTW